MRTGPDSSDFSSMWAGPLSIPVALRTSSAYSATASSDSSGSVTDMAQSYAMPSPTFCLRYAHMSVILWTPSLERVLTMYSVPPM